ncbi:aldo/keto reductase [Streptomyces shenzhenensis]|uniref:Aldo/keto reductase n=1 Tax=Streptomyces shenzhenensis TaxID=943815 RepID=A0A3M0I8V1_9ACTN|nr:aldo/keto reductase [Streptomyces shenzhenensis]RMB84752.1 aldo/keto reductase [Streptomyces shenzhenensis]
MTDRLGFGAASIGNLYREVSDEDAHAVLEEAWAGGIRSYDTAPHYGLGLSERRLGTFLRQQARDTYRLSTKVGRLIVPNTGRRHGTDEANGFVVPDDHVRHWDPSLAGVRRSLEASLERLGIDRVDTLFLHDPDVYGLDEGLRLGLPALARLREAGLVDEIGVGVNSVEAAVRAVREGDLDVVMIAGRYTLLEQPAAEELLPLCQERGVRVLAVAVFNSGLLASDNPAAAHYNYGAVPPELVDRTERLREVCARFDISLPAAAIQYPLRHLAVDQVVVGTARTSSLRANLQHMKTEIPDELWETLRDEQLIP